MNNIGGLVSESLLLKKEGNTMFILSFLIIAEAYNKLPETKFTKSQLLAFVNGNKLKGYQITNEIILTVCDDDCSFAGASITKEAVELFSCSSGCERPSCISGRPISSEVRFPHCPHRVVCFVHPSHS